MADPRATTPETLSLQDVFKTQGTPTVTYVQRGSGVYEDRLRESIQSRGTLSLLTGPSKTGKTSLYTKVLRELDSKALVVRCDASLTASQFWRTALEKLEFARLDSLDQAKGRSESTTGGLKAELGFKLFGGLSSKLEGKVGHTANSTEKMARVLADPSPEHLVPLLIDRQVMLVVEDFHYLSADAQRTVFQQWKGFVDNEISVLVVGTTHHAVDLARANKDLMGRIAHIDLGTWERDDLAKIVIQGFSYLGVVQSEEVSTAIAKEAAGLPIVAQAVCHELCISKKITRVQTPEMTVGWGKADVFHALHQVAKERYGPFEPIYQRLTQGPRKRARRYNTYELIFSTFSLDPLVFSLRRDEIQTRLRKLPIPSDHVPPNGSLNSTFKALGQFQKKLGIELLEWSGRDERLFILEPAFLFYLRWRQPRNASPSLVELLSELINAGGSGRGRWTFFQGKKS